MDIVSDNTNEFTAESLDGFFYVGFGECFESGELKVFFFSEAGDIVAVFGDVCILHIFDIHCSDKVFGFFDNEFMFTVAFFEGEFDFFSFFDISFYGDYMTTFEEDGGHFDSIEMPVGVVSLKFNGGIVFSFSFIMDIEGFSEYISNLVEIFDWEYIG